MKKSALAKTLSPQNNAVMKKLIALIALGLISPGLYDIGKAVQVRRTADAQARAAVEQGRIEAATKITSARAQQAAADYQAQNPKMIWSYDQGTQRWVQHQQGVSVRQSRGGF